jgi:ABC-type multidrug transport system ATPase subunit
VAWLPQAISIYPGVNVREYVALSGWLKGMTRGAAWEASTRALEQVALSGRAQDSVSKLSGGQRRRLGIAGAIVHDAQVILLDEPTANLDPAQRRRFRDTLQTLNEERTVIVSSHDTEDAQDAYSSVFLLNDGTFRFRGSTEQFMSGTDIALPTSQRMQASYERWVGAEE